MNGTINLEEDDNRTQLLSREDLERTIPEAYLKAVKMQAKVNAKVKKKKSKEDKKKEKEEKERKRLWDDILNIDYYSLFKLFGPIIPTFPSIYAIVRSIFEDTSNSSLSNWFKIFEFIENLNVCIYSIAAAIFYKIFEKKKKAVEAEFKKKVKENLLKGKSKAEKDAPKKKKKVKDKDKDEVRMKFAEKVQTMNRVFLVFCFIVSAVKLVLGILLAPLDQIPDNQPKGLFYFYLVSKIGLIIAQLFYLWTVYVKKYYKSRPIIDDAAADGILDNDDDDDDPGKKDDKDDPKKKKEEKEEEKKPKENGKSKKDQENFEKVLDMMEKNNKSNEDLLRRLQDMNELNQNWIEVKNELLLIQRQNLVLLKFSQPLIEDVELKISSQTDKTENQSIVINVKIYESVKDVKQKIVEKLKLNLRKTEKIHLKTSQVELRDYTLIEDYNLDDLKQGLLFDYYDDV